MNIEVGSGELFYYFDNEYEDVGVIIINDVNDVLLFVDMFVSVNKLSEV